jgi:hypothetical protein
LLGGAAIVYAIAVVYNAPLFLSRIVPLVTMSYSGFGAFMGLPFHERVAQIALQSSFVIIPLLALLAIKGRPKIASALVIVLATTTVIFCLQLKGWRYHKLAAQSTAFLLLALLFGESLGGKGAQRASQVRIAASCLFVAAYLFIFAPISSLLKTQGQAVSPAIRNLVFTEPKETRIAVLSVAPEHAFYILDRAKRPQWSRHYGMWMLPGLLAAQQELPQKGKAVVELNLVRREFVADITCVPPDVIVSERGQVRGKVAPIAIDTLGFLQDDPEFSAWFDASYQPAESFEIYTVWRLKGLKPRAGLCPRDP